MYALSGRTAEDVWRAAVELFKEGGPACSQPGRGGATAEILHVGMTIKDPRQRWIFTRTPAMNPAFALVEVIWILAGRRDAALPTHWNPVLPRFSGDAPEHDGAYGYRLRDHFGIDQLDRVYRVLDSAPDSRQAVLQIWDARVDLPFNDGSPARPDIPCNVVAFPKVRNGRLEWLQVLRSNDLFLGVPHNIVQFTALQEVVAGWLEVEPGEYHHMSDSLHVYERDLKFVRETPIGISTPQSTTSFALDRASWDKAFPDVIRRLEGMMPASLSASTLRALAVASDVPLAYENALRVAAADTARRRGWLEVAHEAMDGCNDTALKVLWERWNQRCGGRRQA
ncbi:MAG TPA: thymidylate synthase [Longimicrobium sp.]|jgi:thymidylate synthase